jgi:DNA-binding transcriptional LysR family regulator
MAGSSTSNFNVHFQQLVYLRELGRGGSLREVAERLHISQPALSQSLAELERRLGLAIFHRHGRKRSFSAEGEELLEFARRSLEEADELLLRLQSGVAGESGRLRVGMIDAASLYILPTAIREHRRKHAAVRLELRVAASGELLDLLRAHEIDLAFVTGPFEERGLTTEELVEEKLFLYGPRDARLSPTSEWVLYPQGSHTRHAIDAALAEREILPHVVLESANPSVLRQMVHLGLGWSILPRRIAEGQLPKLRRRGSRAVTTRSLMAVYREAQSNDRRLCGFLDLARRLAR